MTDRHTQRRSSRKGCPPKKGGGIRHICYWRRREWQRVFSLPVHSSLLARRPGFEGHTRVSPLPCFLSAQPHPVASQGGGVGAGFVEENRIATALTSGSDSRPTMLSIHLLLCSLLCFCLLSHPRAMLFSLGFSFLIWKLYVCVFLVPAFVVCCFLCFTPFGAPPSLPRTCNPDSLCLPLHRATLAPARLLVTAPVFAFFALLPGVAVVGCCACPAARDDQPSPCPCGTGFLAALASFR